MEEAQFQKLFEEAINSKYSLLVSTLMLRLTRQDVEYRENIRLLETENKHLRSIINGRG